MKDFKFKNYTYDSNSVDTFYTKNTDPEDSWLQIINEGNGRGLIIIQVEKCQTVNAFFVPNEDTPNLPEIIQEKL